MESTINSVLITQQWILISITLVYVVATILISIFNFRSAKATREQVQESKRQYEETKRLSMQPYFDISVDTDNSSTEFDTQLRLTLGSNFKRLLIRIGITNIGLGTAKDIQFSLSTIPESPEITWKLFKVTALLKGDKFDPVLSFIADFEQAGERFQKTAFLQIKFQDLLDNEYIATVDLRFIKMSDRLSLQTYEIHQGLVTKLENPHA